MTMFVCLTCIWHRVQLLVMMEQTLEMCEDLSCRSRPTGGSIPLFSNQYIFVY